MDVRILMGQMLILGAMMLLGYFICKKNWVSEESTAHISRLVVNVFNPLLILSSVLGEHDSIDGAKLRQNLLLVVIYYVVLIAFSLLMPILLRAPKQHRSIFCLMSTFVNLGFMGIPVIKGIYGNEAVVYVSFYVLFYNLLIYTYGTFLCMRAAKECAPDKEEECIAIQEALKKMVNPGVAAALLAIVILVTKVNLPSQVSTFCDYMGNTTIPLSMILIGISIGNSDLKVYLKDLRMYLFVAIRMVLFPILVALVLSRFTVDSMIGGVFILEMAMPAGSIVGLMIREHGADYEYCMKGTVITTIFSIVTLPLVGIFIP